MRATKRRDQALRFVMMSWSFSQCMFCRGAFDLPGHVHRQTKRYSVPRLPSIHPSSFSESSRRRRWRDGRSRDDAADTLFEGRKATLAQRAPSAFAPTATAVCRGQTRHPSSLSRSPSTQASPAGRLPFSSQRWRSLTDLAKEARSSVTSSRG